MHKSTHFLPHAAAALATAMSVGCSDSTAPPPPAAVIEVTIATTGAAADMDPDGYFISLDGRAPQPIDDNGVLTFEGLTNGTHLVDISGLAPKCVLEGSARQNIYISAQTGAAARMMVLFSVSCKSEVPVPSPWDY